MSTWSNVSRFSLLALIVLSTGVAQERASEPAPLRLTIVGASLSAGFQDGPATGGAPDNRTAALQKVVRGWLGDGGAVQSRANVVMFTDPVKFGEQQLSRVVKDGADLLLGIDFLFWYGYGYLGASAVDELPARLANLEVGLAQLDRFAGPIVVGDLPDMHGAAARMLSPRQIPSVETLAALNERIAAWAKAHANVHLLPVRSLVVEMKEQGVSLPLAQGAVKVPPGGMLQGDHLHPNRIGMAWLGFLLQDHVRAALPKAVGDRLPKSTLEQFLATAGAESDLADLAASKEPAGKAGGAGGK